MSARKPINCQFCGRLIPQKKNLQSHIDRKHTQEYLHQKQSKKEQKESEIRIKFKCLYCTSTFTRKFNRDQHILSFHNEKIQKNTSDAILNEQPKCFPEASDLNPDPPQIDINQETNTNQEIEIQTQKVQIDINQETNTNQEIEIQTQKVQITQ
jgi:hypothetical protein